MRTLIEKCQQLDEDFGSHFRFCMSTKLNFHGNYSFPSLG